MTADRVDGANASGAYGEVEPRCPDCEWTPSGFFAHPCEAHGCPSCGHVRHDAEDGCGQPDPLTGWCECEADSLASRDSAPGGAA
jgi:ribosomal protein S27E